MKKIHIKEGSLNLIKESQEEVTFGEFYSSLKDFLKGLLVKPHETEVCALFKSHGTSKDDLIKKMKKIGLIKSKENITEVPIDESKLRAKHTIVYMIPRKRFYEKAKELYKQLFQESVFADEESMKKAILDSEDGNVYRTRGGIKI